MMDRVPEARHLLAAGADLAGDRLNRGLRIDAFLDPLCASTSTAPQSSGRAEDDRAAAEDAGGDRALQRVRRRVVGHARGDRGRRQAVLGDGDKEKVEEEALARSAPRPVMSR